MATVSEVNVGLRAYAHLPAGRMLRRNVSHSSFAELVVGIQGIIPEGRDMCISFYDKIAGITFHNIDRFAYRDRNFSKRWGYFIAGFSGRVITSQVIAYEFSGNSQSGTLFGTGSVIHGDFDE